MIRNGSYSLLFRTIRCHAATFCVCMRKNVRGVTSAIAPVFACLRGVWVLHQRRHAVVTITYTSCECHLKLLNDLRKHMLAVSISCFPLISEQSSTTNKRREFFAKKFCSAADISLVFFFHSFCCMFAVFVHGFFCYECFCCCFGIEEKTSEIIKNEGAAFDYSSARCT